MKTNKIKFYQIQYYDTFVNDYGQVESGAVTEVVSEDRLQWYKEHCNLWDVREVAYKQRRRVTHI